MAVQSTTCDEPPLVYDCTQRSSRTALCTWATGGRRDLDELSTFPPVPWSASSISFKNESHVVSVISSPARLIAQQSTASYRRARLEVTTTRTHFCAHNPAPFPVGAPTCRRVGSLRLFCTCSPRCQRCFQLEAPESQKKQQGSAPRGQSQAPDGQPAACAVRTSAEERAARTPASSQASGTVVLACDELT